MVTEDNLFDFLLSRAKYDGRSGCLLWTGHRNSGGYGYVNLALVKDLGFRHTSVSVHRLAYRAFRDETVPDGYELHHTCGRRNCLNAWHLRAVTPLEHARLDPGRQAQRRKCTANLQMRKEDRADAVSNLFAGHE
jgi:hypothetical protein